MATGITTRHHRRCPSRAGGKCGSPCAPVYEAWVWDKREKKKIAKRFSSLTEAKNWRGDAVPAVRKRELKPPSKLTLEAAALEWLALVDSDVIISRKKKQPYKPSVKRSYRTSLTKHVFPDLGARRLSDVTADDVQALIERMGKNGKQGQTVRNVIVALQGVYRRYRREVIMDPTKDLDLPSPGGSRSWEGTPADAKELLDPLPFDLRALYATAFYAGLRRGELRALRVKNLHGLDGEGEPFISVEQSWDPYEGEIEPKSAAGVRNALMPETLRLILFDHVKETGRGGDDFVFGRSATEPFSLAIGERADVVWRAAKTGRVTLHVCRHAHGSFLDAIPEISEARCDRYMGHARKDVASRYRHQLKGQLAADAKLLDEYLNDRQPDNVIPITGAQTGAQAVQTASLSQTG